MKKLKTMYLETGIGEYNKKAYKLFMNELSELKRFPPNHFSGLVQVASHYGIALDNSVIEAAKQALLDTFGEENGIEREFTDAGYDWFHSLKMGNIPPFNGKIWE